MQSLSSVAPGDGVEMWPMTTESRKNMRVDKTG